MPFVERGAAGDKGAGAFLIDRNALYLALGGTLLSRYNKFRFRFGK